MDFADLLEIIGAIFLSLGGGAVIVFVLSRYLGGVWATRISQNEDAQHRREFEALVRRRNIYSKLATSLRVFLKRHESEGVDLEGKFLEAYDEASVWAPDSVMNAVGNLLDMVIANKIAEGSVSDEVIQGTYKNCISEMRKDSGFVDTKFEYRVVNF